MLLRLLLFEALRQHDLISDSEILIALLRGLFGLSFLFYGILINLKSTNEKKVVYIKNRAKQLFSARTND